MKPYVKESVNKVKNALIDNIAAYDSINVTDFEYNGHVVLPLVRDRNKKFVENGAFPKPVCVVSRDLKSGKTIRLIGDELFAAKNPPYATDSKALFISYNAEAELRCHLALNWPIPQKILDLCAEFKLVSNPWIGKVKPNLLVALRTYGLPCMDSLEKEDMIKLILEGVWTAEQAQEILDYCTQDVDGLEKLFYAMQKDLDPPRCLLRGEYVGVTARIEQRGIPVNKILYDDIHKNKDFLKQALIDEFNKEYGFFDGYVFKDARYSEWVSNFEKKHLVKWPRTETKRYSRDKDELESLAMVYEEVAPIWRILADMSTLSRLGLLIGPDSRNRYSIQPFASKTSRNQPSTSKNVFGSGWLRGLIRPEKGRALAYIDFNQEEFAIAARLSQDKHMLRDYEAGDCYTAMGIMLGMIPPDGNKKTHPKERNICKTISLAILYRMTAHGLAPKIKRSKEESKEILKKLEKGYATYFTWSDNLVFNARRAGQMTTKLGWRMKTRNESNRTIANFPMQANGADILRAAAILLEEEGIQAIAPVHDAFLIEAKDNEIEEAIAATQRCMTKAAKIVIGYEIRASKDQVIYYPNHYIPDAIKGIPTWDRINSLLERIHNEQTMPSSSASAA